MRYGKKKILDNQTNKNIMKAYMIEIKCEDCDKLMVGLRTKKTCFDCKVDRKREARELKKLSTPKKRLNQ